MKNVISMRRLRDGLRLSKEARLALSDLLLRGLKRKVSNAPRSFKPANDMSSNQFGVEKDQIWESLDPRDVSDGEPRQVQVVVVGDSHAIVDNLRTGTRSSISLNRFSGRTKKGFKLLAPLRSAELHVVH